MTKNEKHRSFTKGVVSTTAINKATSRDLETVEGVHSFLAKRIIAYRNRLMGFTYQSQLLEVWKLDKEVAKNVWDVLCKCMQMIAKKLKKYVLVISLRP